MMKKFLFLISTALISIVLTQPTGVLAGQETWRTRLSSGTDFTASDVEAEIRFGREVAARILGRYGLLENAELMKYVNLVGLTVAKSTARPELQFRFAVLDTDEVNAYAAPGGYVFVTRGAIARMEDEAELAGVIAHEIAHIVERHIVKDLNIKSSDASAVSGLATVIGGSTEAARLAFSQMVDKAVDMLFKDGYRREDETQADQDAVLFSALAGYDPAGLVRYFDRLSSEKGKQTEVLDRTHPAYETRIAALNGVINEEGMAASKYMINKERFTSSAVLK